MPAANRIGRQRIAYSGRPPGGGGAGRREQGDLGRGVEAEPEQEPERVHLPRARDRAGRASVEAVHEAARVQLLLELVLRELAAAHAQEDPDDPDQHDQVEDPDQQQERSRDRRADQAAGAVQRRAVARDVAAEALDAQREADGEQEDDRRVPEREEEPDPERPLAVGHQLARRVVDRADVIGVEGVAQAERVGRDPDADAECARAELEVGGLDDADQQSEPDDVQRHDRQYEQAGAPPLGGSQRPADPLPARPRGAQRRHPPSIGSSAA